MAKKPTDAVQLKLRFSERLRARLERAADKNKESMNSEIIKRLERSFEAEDLVATARQHLAKAKAIEDAAYVKAIRAAGWQIARDHGDGGKITVQVSSELLLAEADGIMRSGFIDQESLRQSPTEIAIENAVERALEKRFGKLTEGER